MIYPKSLEELIKFYKKLPGIGEKNAERLALATINMDKEIIDSAASILSTLNDSIKKCSICGHLSDNDICQICLNESRNKNLICVVEDYKSVFTFEKIGNFNGVYHVLNGLISPIDNIGPNNINIGSLVKRLKKLENPEIILALKSTIEGETTSLYIKKILENEKVIVSRLSYGIPIGTEIDYLDVVTLNKALEDRRQINE